MSRKFSHFLVSLWLIVAALMAVGQGREDGGPVTAVIDALRAGNLTAASAALQSVTGPLGSEEQAELIRAVDRLSPGVEAVPFLRALAGKNPGSAELVFLIARSYWRAGDIDSALRVASRALSLEPENTRLLYQAAALAQTVDRVEQAERWLSTLLDKEPDHADGLFLLGRIRASQGRDEAARRLLQRVVATQPTHFLAQYELGRLEIRAGNNEEAEGHLRAAVKAYPFFREAYNSLLVALARQKKSSEVAQVRTIVDRLNAWDQTKENRMRHAFRFPDGLGPGEGYELALELCRVQRDDLAKSFLERVLEKGTAGDQQMMLLASLRYKERDFSGCLNLLNRLRDTRYTETDLFVSLKAWSLFLLGRVEESRNYYTQVLQDHKESSNLKALAEALERIGASPVVRSATEGIVVEPPFRFVDATRRAGLAGFRHILGHADKRWITDAMGSGVAVGDYDNDGDDDIYFVNGRPDLQGAGPEWRNALFRNDGGYFTDVTQEAGVGDTGYGMSAIFGDIDNDGWLDLFVGNFGPNVLYRNMGDGTFMDITRRAGAGDDGYVAATAFADVDRDGDLDLFVGNYVDFDPEKHGSLRDRYHGLEVFAGPLAFPHQKDILYLNNGAGVFQDASERAGVNISPGRAMGAVFFDLENDGDLDLYVTNDSTYNHVLRNRGDGTFEDISFESGGAFTESGVEGASMGVIAGDYNNDGFVDLFVTSYEQQSDIIFENDGQSGLSDVTTSLGLHAPSYWLVTWGSAFCDFDCDGLLDIFTSNGHIYPQVESLNVGRHYEQGVSFYRNTGRRFTDVSKTAVPPDFQPKCGRGAALIDFDSDGDMDIIINCIDSSPMLLENQSSRGHWLQVTLDAPCARTFGVRVVARKGDRIWTRTVDGGSGYLSQSSQTLHFGFGPVDSIDELTVYWFHRSPQVIPSPPIDSRIKVSP